MINKKLSNSWIQPNPTRSKWVGLNPWNGLGWIFNLSWWVGPKKPLNPTQPNPCTPLMKIMTFKRISCVKDKKIKK